MAILKFNNIGIKAISACVPKTLYNNNDLGYLIPEQEIEKTIESIGIKQRRIADEDVFASDLCIKAAQQLFKDNKIDPSTIDVLLFMSQTGDYRIPATSPIIQHKLGLSKNVLALDISLGCSGYIFALSTAFAFASNPCVKRVLLLDGETFSKIVNKRDKVDWPLYGDAGTATLIERGEYSNSTFTLFTDGSGEDAVKIPAGMRNKITEDSCIETEREDGNIRNDLEVYMDGMAVFNFALRCVPKSIKEAVQESEMKLEDIDFLIFHQANKFMTDFFVKKMKFNPDKVPYCLDRFGNTSSSSIPLTIVSELYNKLKDGDKILLSGFGAGLSWGTALLVCHNINISKLIEY